jgi:hypothetical protein
MSKNRFAALDDSDSELNYSEIDLDSSSSEDELVVPSDNTLFENNLISWLAHLADIEKNRRYLRLQHDDDVRKAFKSWTESESESDELYYQIWDICRDKVESHFGKVDVMDTMDLLIQQFGTDIGNSIGCFLFWNHPFNKEYIEKRAPWTLSWYSRVNARFHAYAQFYSFTYFGAKWVWKEDEKEIKKLFFRRMNCCDYKFNQTCQRCLLIDEEIKKRTAPIEMKESRKLLVQRSKDALQDTYLGYNSNLYYRVQINEFHKSEMDTWVRCGLLKHDEECDHCKEDGPFPNANHCHHKYCYYTIRLGELRDIQRELERKFPDDPRFNEQVYCEGDDW